jgi:metallo-beta-lactamase family protein
MQIAFHGAAQTVTGSRHLLSTNGHHLLMDCGLYQGRRKATYDRNLNFPFDPDQIDSVLLSHAHIDHSGNIPNLVRQGYSGPIHSTHATMRLTDIMTRDSGHIQEYDVKFLNKRRARQGKPPVEPLYTIQDAAAAAKQLVGHDYATAFEPIPGVSAQFTEAGHILGSAGIVLDIAGEGGNVRLMFSGDIGRADLPIVRDPVLPDEVDYLIMECTYGDRPHAPVDKAFTELGEVIGRTIARGGKVIIPAFAVGRTQSLVYWLHQMIDNGELERIPVFVDSPLAINITELFKQFPDCFDEQATQFMKDDPHGSALGFDLLTFTRSVEASKAINDVHGPAVIISASGMAETGRILHHLRNNIEDSKNTVLISSWMAPHTLGRRLAEGRKQVRIFGEPHRVEAEVVRVNGFSAHGGQTALIEYAKAAKDRVKAIFLVHGEAGPAETLSAKLSDLGIKVHYPEMGEVVQLT